MQSYPCIKDCRVSNRNGSGDNTDLRPPSVLCAFRISGRYDPEHDRRDTEGSADQYYAGQTARNTENQRYERQIFLVFHKMTLSHVQPAQMILPAFYMHILCMKCRTLRCIHGILQQRTSCFHGRLRYRYLIIFRKICTVWIKSAIFLLFYTNSVNS